MIIYSIIIIVFPKLIFSIKLTLLSGNVLCLSHHLLHDQWNHTGRLTCQSSLQSESIPKYNTIQEEVPTMSTILS